VRKEGKGAANYLGICAEMNPNLGEAAERIVGIKRAWWSKLSDGEKGGGFIKTQGGKKSKEETILEEIRALHLRQIFVSWNGGGEKKKERAG